MSGRHLAALALVTGTSSCTGQSSLTAPEVGALFAATLDACAQPLMPDGSFDQKAVAAASWIITSRTLRRDAEERNVDAASYPVLRANEYESTSWTSYAHQGELNISRWHVGTQTIPDRCEMQARAVSKDDVAIVVRELSQKMGVAVARQGEVPRGGDFLTPRDTTSSYSYYWPLKQHEVYLTVVDKQNMRLDIEAVLNRKNLNPDFNTPEKRIPSGDVKL